MGGLLAPALEQVVAQHGGGVAQVRSTRLALLIERFRRRHGRLPAALKDLVPDFIASIPVDPFMGKELHYLPEAEGFRVYSVGKNLKDDQGQTPEDHGLVIRYSQKK